MDYIERTLQKNCVYQGKIFSVFSDDVLLPDGEKSKRDIVDHIGGACVLYQKDGKFLFVKQYRYAYKQEIYEIPAGRLEIGEDSKRTALRELEEEAGIRTKDASLLFVLYPTPGYTNEKIYIYEASGGEIVQNHLDEGEFLSVVWIEEGRVREMIRNGEIVDAKTLVALQSYFLRKAEK